MARTSSNENEAKQIQTASHSFSSPSIAMQVLLLAEQPHSQQTSLPLNR